MFITRLDEYDYTLPANDEWTAIKAEMIVTELSRKPVGGKEEGSLYSCLVELIPFARNINFIQ